MLELPESRLEGYRYINEQTDISDVSLCIERNIGS